MIKIIIADDHQIFIDGMRSLLEHESDIEIIGIALNGYEVLDLLALQAVDIVLMDINMPGLDGIKTTKIVAEKYQDTKVLMLTMYNTIQYIVGLAEAGASGYVLKNTGKQELLQAIHTVASGKNFYSQNVMQAMLDNDRKKYGSNKIDEPQLSKREIEILKLIAQEFTTNEIADKLFISQNTVETHRKNLFDKLSARNIAGLVKYAFQNNLLD